MTRVLQISDTHLSRTKPHFTANWAPLRDWMLRQNADLIIHTGDLTVDGADHEEDMREGAELMRSVQAAFLAVPGNHESNGRWKCGSISAQRFGSARWPIPTARSTLAISRR